MRDPESGLQIFDPRAIKAASLKYCHDLLNSRKGDEEYQKYYFIQDMIHVVRINWDDKDAETVCLQKMILRKD